MTTVFGLTHPKIEAAILIADKQTTASDQRTGMPLEKRIGRKLKISEDKQYAFGNSGLFDEEFYKLTENLAKGEFDVEKIIKENYFKDLRELNLDRMGRTLPDPKKLSGLLLSTRFEKNPKIYTCFPLGQVETRELVAIGSGEQKVMEYFQAKQILNEGKDYLTNDEPTLNKMITFGLEAVRRAQNQDIYSSGLDMVVCLPEEIKDHSKDLSDMFGEQLKKINEQYK